ncbi:TPA: AAA family ATPase [Streptococcus pyogenes]|uniref:AAA family ATPase n=1 Tax=Streptococcus pyogenes TaxID=1314 RepID=UPI00109C4FB4|nr:AAA family ATPase [Streptococcus pyogenes]VHM22461.1 shikimate kinase [Streptococcus pyogenes]HEP1679670.1 AAA family ATPase [Streptococcus pyogenes]HEP2149381.1 AAA family ATPase [Streptococcus pyogenes]HEP2164552.1 AAA family ATPase [Streptococcus pyogenes]HER8406366.1 AAA family ATPase [Streptococcus pyogenes]
MNLIIIGAQASGKMTIGQEVARQTGMTLFHNHDSIDFVLRFMPWSQESTALIERIRFAFFETFAKTGQDMIFTIVIDFNDPNDVAMLEKIQAVFQSYDQEVLFVELKTDIEERLKRNRTENRLKYKPLKRNIECSEQDIQSTMAYAVFNPDEPAKTLTHYQKINNTQLTAAETAQLIIQKMTHIKEN